MSLLVTGTIAIDSVKTPFGEKPDCLGGSATYFSVAASHFTPVRLVGAVGDDFPDDYLNVFDGRDIDTSGLERRAGSKTFRWKGRYEGSMNEAQTLETQLNILAEEPPVIGSKFRDSQYVFLANTAPAVQIQLLEQLEAPAVVVADTMNYWIENTRDDLLELIGRINALVLNDTEARMLTGRDNLIGAAREITRMGPNFVVVKKGEHGTLLCTGQGELFVLPAYPTEAVKDPTGAGDSFAGGMMGYLRQVVNTEPDSLKKAIAYGTVVASLVIEDFSLNRWDTVGRDDIEQRLHKLGAMMRF